MTEGRLFPFVSTSAVAPHGRPRSLQAGVVALLLAIPASAFQLFPAGAEASTAADPITEYPILDGLQATTITAGSDGNVWFVQGAGGTLHEVGRMTPSGTVTEFVSPATVPRTTNPFGSNYYTGGDYDPTTYVQLVAGKDGDIWYPYLSQVGYAGSGLVQITPAGTYTAYDTDLSPDQFDGGLTVAGDGRIWAVVGVRPADSAAVTACPGHAAFGGSLATFTPDAVDTPAGVVPVPAVNGRHLGALTRYAVSCVNATTPLVIGPDHNLWFTGSLGTGGSGVIPSGVSTIGRLDPTSPPGNPSVRWFTVPSGSSVRDLTAGPDGALWFTESNYANGPREWGIGRVTTDGSFQEYVYRRTTSEDLGGATAMYIATGKDGALWFTESDTGSSGAASQHVGRLTTCGRVDVYDPIATRASDNPAFGNPLGPIVSGPDGTMWFTESDPYIGRVSLHAVGPPMACSATTSRVAAHVTDYLPIHRF